MVADPHLEKEILFRKPSPGSLFESVFVFVYFLAIEPCPDVGPAKNACQLVNILDDTKLVLPTSSVVWKAGPCQLCSRTRLSIANLRAVFALAHIHLRQCMDTNPKHSIEKNIYLDTVLECCCSNQHVLYETNSSAVFYFFWFCRGWRDQSQMGYQIFFSGLFVITSIWSSSSANPSNASLRKKPHLKDIYEQIVKSEGEEMNLGINCICKILQKKLSLELRSFPQITTKIFGNFLQLSIQK